MSAMKTIERFCKEKSFSNDDNLFIRKLRIGGLSDDQIALVIVAVDNVCHECWDAGLGCQCWNDE